MALQFERHLFTLDEFERMVESGGFYEDTRIELIEGEIIDMTPLGTQHEACVTKLTTFLIRKAGDNAVVSTQNSIRIPNRSRPQLDVALLRWRDDYYAAKPPMPEDVLLVIEVAESSLAYDRSVKGPLYAKASISEYWIVNLKDQVIEMYANPTNGAYKQVKKARRGETLSLPTLLEGAIEVSDILGAPTLA